IGAFLLDHDNPGKVIGRLREPLLKPDQRERKGYVPNVVYTCGALLHKGELIIPYGMADHATGFATVPLAEVLAAMHSEIVKPHDKASQTSRRAVADSLANASSAIPPPGNGVSQHH